MRRDTRRKPENLYLWEDKKILLGASVVLGIIVLIVGISVYSSVTGNKPSKYEPNQIISLAPEDELNNGTESASSSIGNKVNETEATNSTETNTNANANNTITKNTKTNTIAKETAETITKNKEEKQESENTAKKAEKSETKPTGNTAEKIKFDWPVKGDILKAFSLDNLLYSSTLKEWTVHNGIDIKADKATIVCSAEDGTVKSIKNDPRYGLTVIIEHADGYKTVYSNLLTTEFVVEGEKVTKGQSIGTVGNTANFEVADDFHLHFEVLKDDNCVDPMIYLK